MSGAAEAPATGSLALLRAAAAYAEEALPLPPVPRDLVDRVVERAAWAWSTAEVDLLDRDEFLARALDPAAEASVAFGYTGYGVASWWMGYQLIDGGLAVFLRQGYGGPYGDHDATAAALAAAFTQLAELLVLARHAVAEGELGPQRRLVVLIDSREESGWGLTGEPADWRLSDAPLRDALRFLDP